MIHLTARLEAGLKGLPGNRRATPIGGMLVGENFHSLFPQNRMAL